MKKRTFHNPASINEYTIPKQEFPEKKNYAQV